MPETRVVRGRAAEAGNQRLEIEAAERRQLGDRCAEALVGAPNQRRGAVRCLRVCLAECRGLQV